MRQSTMNKPETDAYASYGIDESSATFGESWGHLTPS